MYMHIIYICIYIYISIYIYIYVCLGPLWCLQCEMSFNTYNSSTHFTIAGVDIRGTSGTYLAASLRGCILDSAGWMESKISVAAYG